MCHIKILLIQKNVLYYLKLKENSLYFNLYNIKWSFEPDLNQRPMDKFKKSPKVRLTQAFVKVRIQCLEEYWITFKNLHSALLEGIQKEEKDDLSYFINDIYETCEEQYLNLKTDMEEIRSTFEEETFHNASTVSASFPKSSAVKLPKIDLPKFYGEYENWEIFEDAFVTLIHNNNSLSDVQRLHYLKSCLEGEASTTLKSYKVTENNYIPAWDALKKRYCHKRLIVNAIFKSLFSLKKILKQSTSQLKELIDKVKESITGLNNVGITTNLWDPILIFIVTQKLDFDTHKEWEDFVSKEYDTELPLFKDLLNFLEGRVYTLELMSFSSKDNKDNKDNKEIVRTFHVSYKERVCNYCNEVGHTLYLCKEFEKINIEDRKNFVINQRLCFNCLYSGHNAYECKQKFTCKYCGWRHCSLLHYFKDSKKKETEEDLLVGKVLQESKKQNDQRNKTVEVALNSHYVIKRSTTLLATAIVPVKDNFGQIFYLRALVDQGSQATFITERAAQMLKLKRYSFKGSITGVGNVKTVVKNAVRVELFSNYEKEFNFNVKAYIMPVQITTQIPTKPIERLPWPHIEGLPLADMNFNKPGNIDLLLGVEVCAQILNSEMIRGPKGTPCAQKTTLGWVLFGEVINSLTNEERICENLFKESNTSDDRYIAKLPVNSNLSLSTQAGTKELVQKKYTQLKSRIFRNSNLKYTKMIE